MASFEQHTKSGVLLGYFLVTFFILNNIISDKIEVIYVLIANFIGSFLPDLDSDSGKPFEIVFDILGGLISLIILFYCIETLNGNFWAILILPTSTFLIFKFVIGNIFKIMTSHRGLFHSTPALIISTLLTNTILKRTIINNNLSTILSISVGVGFFSHLILDVIFSGIKSLNPIKFFKIFLKCFKLWSKSQYYTLIIWSVVIILTFDNLNLFKTIYHNIILYLDNSF